MFAEQVLANYIKENNFIPDGMIYRLPTGIEELCFSIVADIHMMFTELILAIYS